MLRKYLVKIIVIIMVVLFVFSNMAYAAARKTVIAPKGTPKIDGKIDKIWSKAKVISVKNTPTDVLPNKSTDTAKVRVMWDSKYLYILAEVKDAKLNLNGPLDGNGDSIEFDIDFANNKKAEDHDFMPANPSDYKAQAAGVFRVEIAKGGPDVSGFGPAFDAAMKDKKFIGKHKIVKGGYIAEAAIPWIKIKPKVGKVIGFDVQINDDSTGNTQRDGVVTWNNMITASWHYTDNMGYLKLAK